MKYNKFVLPLLATLLALTLCACSSWTCDKCGKDFTGTAYYGVHGSETFCEDCARSYWMGIPYRNYVK